MTRRNILSTTKLFGLALLLIVLHACGNNVPTNPAALSITSVLNSKNLDSIKLAKNRLYAQQQELSEQIKLLNDKISELDENSKFPLITALTTTESAFSHFIELQGNVATKDIATVSAEFNGLLTKVVVKKGDVVKKGQTLAMIDDGGLVQQLAQMQIQRDLAQTTFERQKRLWEQNIGSEIQYLQAKSNVDAQNEAINQMRKQLAKTKVTAPFSGTIDDIITEQGNLVGLGTPLMRLVNLDNMYIETEVPERYIADVIKSKSVEIEFPILGKTMNSTVRQASAFINPANRTFTVEVPLAEKDPNIKPNLTAKLRINDYSNAGAILIPQNIISEDALGAQYVYVLKDLKDQVGIAARTTITTGKAQGDVIEVLSGLKPDMTIIKEGARSVKDGQRVRLSIAE